MNSKEEIDKIKESLILIRDSDLISPYTLMSLAVNEFFNQVYEDEKTDIKKGPEYADFNANILYSYDRELYHGKVESDGEISNYVRNIRHGRQSLFGQEYYYIFGNNVNKEWYEQYVFPANGFLSDISPSIEIIRQSFHLIKGIGLVASPTLLALVMEVVFGHIYKEEKKNDVNGAEQIITQYNDNYIHGKYRRGNNEDNYIRNIRHGVSKNGTYTYYYQLGNHVSKKYYDKYVSILY